MHQINQSIFHHHDFIRLGAIVISWVEGLVVVDATVPAACRALHRRVSSR